MSKTKRYEIRCGGEDLGPYERADEARNVATKLALVLPKGKVVSVVNLDTGVTVASLEA